MFSHGGLVRSADRQAQNVPGGRLEIAAEARQLGQKRPDSIGTFPGSARKIRYGKEMRDAQLSL